MAHIHDLPGQHDATVSACIVRTDGPEPAIIMHRHRKLNVWLQFGGHVEVSENPWDAITHELAEESGYDINQLKILQPSLRLHTLSGVLLHPQAVCTVTHQFSNLDHYHTDTAFAFVTDQAPSGKHNDDESADIKLFTVKDLKAVPEGEIPENIREICLFVLQELYKNWDAIEAKSFSTPAQ